MKPLNRQYKTHLVNIARAVQIRANSLVQDSRLVVLPITAEESDSYGWYTDIFRLKKVLGRLQIWIDLFPNVNRPILSLCYKSSDLDRIMRVAKAFNPHKHNKPDLSKKNLGPHNDEYRILSKPLSQKYFNTPIIEAYQTNFLTVYFKNKIRPQTKNPTKIITSVTEYAVRLLRAIASTLEAEASTNRIYSAIENRRKVTQHLSRERSQKLVYEVKIRDGFNCQICHFNFSEVYGEIGRGFAEAHHIVPLSKLNKSSVTHLKDLITVCANCHRMLHKMDGKASDIKTLQKIVRKQKNK